MLPCKRAVGFFGVIYVLDFKEIMRAGLYKYFAYLILLRKVLVILGGSSCGVSLSA